MRDAFGQLSGAEKPLREAHPVGAGQQFVDHPPHTCQASLRIAGRHFAGTFEPELDVVEIRDRLPERPLADIGEHRLELAERLPGQVSQRAGDALMRNGTGDKNHHPPVVFPVEIIEFAVFGRHDAQHPAFHIFAARFGQLAANVRSNPLDVALQQADVLENKVINPLQHIIRHIARRRNTVGIVDPSAAYRSDLYDLAGNIK